MKKIFSVVVLILVSCGLATQSFGFGGLNQYGANRDFNTLALADRMGAFTPASDPFQGNPYARSMPRVSSPAYYAPRPAMPSPAAVPQVTARDLMNPNTGGLAFQGRTMAASRTGSSALPQLPRQPRSYALPSDIGLHSVTPSYLPR